VSNETAYFGIMNERAAACIGWLLACSGILEALDNSL
jgi:hypothetical protein